MKKITFLLLLFIASLQIEAQTTLANKLRITGNLTDNTATKVNVQDAFGNVNTILKSDLIDAIFVDNATQLTSAIGNVNKLYITKDNNIIYRYNGTIYTALSADISGKEDIINKSSSFTASSTITYPNTKALVDGLATKATEAFVTNAVSTADSGNVKLTGFQSISGEKNFNDYARFESPSGLESKVYALATGDPFAFGYSSSFPTVGSKGNNVGVYSVGGQNAAYFDTSGLTNFNTIFTFPNKPGTFALTSDLETTASIQAKRPLKTINGESIEGTGDVSIIPIEKSFQQILDQPFENFTHTFAGGLRFQNEFASAFIYRDGITVERTNLTGDPGKIEIYPEGLAHTNNQGLRSLTLYPDHGASPLSPPVFVTSVNGNYADATGNVSYETTIPIAPTLQEVLTAGNSADLMTAGTPILYNDFGASFTQLYGRSISVHSTNFEGETNVQLTPDALIYGLNDTRGEVPSVGEVKVIANVYGNNYRTFSYPSKLSGNYTIATIDDLDAKLSLTGGNLTGPIVGTDANFQGFVEAGEFKLYNGVNGNYGGISSTETDLVFSNGTNFPKFSFNFETLTTDKNYILPDKFGTLALTSDIPVMPQIAQQLKDHFIDANNTGITETDLYSYTVDSNRLNSTGEKIIANYAGTFNDVSASSQIRIYFANTLIGDTGPLTMSTTGAFVVTVSIMRTGATTSKAIVNVTTPGASTATYTKYTSFTNEFFTNAKILKITGTAGGATGGSNDITAVYGNILWQPAAQ
jgi:hypothetical protein